MIVLTGCPMPSLAIKLNLRFFFFFQVKKPENIISRFSTAFEEARWRQPAVLVFDDLDNLIFQPDPVKDAEPTIVYQSRLAEGKNNSDNILVCNKCL